MNYQRIHIASYENYEKYEASRHEWVLQSRPPAEHATHEKFRRDKSDRRQRLRERFPHVVLLEGSYPETDFAERRCWQQFGFCDGKCQNYASEYPRYSQPPEHEHVGVWTTMWLGKTGYDYGFMEFYFANESDRDSFLAAVPSLTFGENYN